MKQSQKIVKNIAASGLATGVGGAIQLAAVAIVARGVGVAQFGAYSFIVAYGMFFQQLADLGLCNILIRELARAPERTMEILGAALSLIWVLTAVVGIAMAAVVPLLHLPVETKLLALLMGVATLAQFHAMIYGAVLRAKEENELHAIGFFLHKVLFFLLIVAGLKCGLALLGVVLAHLIPSLFQRGLYGWMVNKRYGRARMLKDVPQWKYLLTHSMPVGGATMLRLVSQQVDVFILTWMRDLRTVGLFSGPYRISMALRFIPQTMSLPLYPMFARMAHLDDGRADLQRAYARSVKFFLVMGLPVTILFAGFSHVLIAVMLGPKYQEAAAAMQWMGLAFLPFFVSDPMPFLLTALNEQRFVLGSTVGAMLLRVGLNFLLIPVWGYVGPCMAFFAGEVVLLALMMIRLGRLGFGLPLAEMAWKPILAAGLMMAALWPCRDCALVMAAPAAVVALVVYVMALWKLNVFLPDEIEVAREGCGFLRPFLEKWGVKLEQAAG